MPVVEINDASKAKPLAEALLAGGIRSIEITLRTEAGLDAIAAISDYANELAIGAGTVVNIEQLKQVFDLGVNYVISPGFSPKLAEEALRLDMNWIPGVSSGSEIMQGMEFGLQSVKLFPAEAVGGINLLKSLLGPFAHISFCPTGGVNKDNMQNYLDLPNVLCVGGSLIAPKALIDAEDWNGITALCREVTKK